MNDIKKEAIKEFKEKFFQLPGVKERDFINKYIDKATLAEQKRLNGLAELATLTQKKKDAEIARYFVPRDYEELPEEAQEIRKGQINASEAIAKAILNPQDDE